MRNSVLVTAMAMGPLLAIDPAMAIQPEAPAGRGGPILAHAAADDRMATDWQKLLIEMQDEGLIAVRAVGRKIPSPPPLPTGRNARPVGHSKSSSPPEGIRMSPCLSP